MFNNAFNGYGSNTFNPVNQNLKNGNIAGLNKGPSSVAGISSSVAGEKNMPAKKDPFANVHIEKNPARQVMNSKGQNLIHNEFRGIKN